MNADKLYRCQWCGLEQPAICFSGKARLICLRCSPAVKVPAKQVGVIGSKSCRVCEREKPLSEFTRHKAYADGKVAVCRWCSRIRGWKAKGITGDFPLDPPAQCEMCGRPNSRLHMDHCHSTGRLRGFICSGCNTGLGLLGDTLDAVSKAMAYMQRVYDSFDDDEGSDQQIS